MLFMFLFLMPGTSDEDVYGLYDSTEVHLWKYSGNLFFTH